MILNDQNQLSKDLIQKYSISVPRYTSYPPAPEWSEGFTKEDFLLANEIANKTKTPISLYFHLPFCESHCYFCACNVVISKKREVVTPYIENIKKEIKNLSNLINKDRVVKQVHLGGGTPTFFLPSEIEDFYKVVKNNFSIAGDCEIGIEIDPRVTTYEHLEVLSRLGFNRLSMGIQDFDLKVQAAINRIQPFEETSEIFSYAKEFSFESINVDLIYGLPCQNEESFAKTIELILKLGPDRIALFHYAHLPQLLKHQERYIDEKALPTSDEKIKIFQCALQTLTDSGYVFIGLDHFARPNDELALARKHKTLHRNFQGYTTKFGCDLYGLGITSISNVQNTFSQNIKKLNPYYDKITQNELPVFRGIKLSKDDSLRREIIMKILCHGEVNKTEIEERYNINFDKYFAFEIEKLNELESDRLVILSSQGRINPAPTRCDPRIIVTDLGQFFLRNIASVFDAYLQEKNGKQRVYSKSI